MAQAIYAEYKDSPAPLRKKVPVEDRARTFRWDNIKTQKFLPWISHETKTGFLKLTWSKALQFFKFHHKCWRFSKKLYIKALNELLSFSNWLSPTFNSQSTPLKKGIFSFWKPYVKSYRNIPHLYLIAIILKNLTSFKLDVFNRSVNIWKMLKKNYPFP